MKFLIDIENLPIGNIESYVAWALHQDDMDVKQSILQFILDISDFSYTVATDRMITDDMVAMHFGNIFDDMIYDMKKTWTKNTACVIRFIEEFVINCSIDLLEVLDAIMYGLHIVYPIVSLELNIKFLGALCLRQKRNDQLNSKIVSVANSIITIYNVDSLRIPNSIHFELIELVFEFPKYLQINNTAAKFIHDFLSKKKLKLCDRVFARLAEAVINDHIPTIGEVFRRDIKYRSIWWHLSMGSQSTQLNILKFLSSITDIPSLASHELFENDYLQTIAVNFMHNNKKDQDLFLQSYRLFAKLVNDQENLIFKICQSYALHRKENKTSFAFMAKELLRVHEITFTELFRFITSKVKGTNFKAIEAILDIIVTKLKLLSDKNSTISESQKLNDLHDFCSCVIDAIPVLTSNMTGLYKIVSFLIECNDLKIILLHPENEELKNRLVVLITQNKGIIDNSFSKKLIDIYGNQPIQSQKDQQVEFERERQQILSMTIAELQLCYNNIISITSGEVILEVLHSRWNQIDHTGFTENKKKCLALQIQCVLFIKIIDIRKKVDHQKVKEFIESAHGLWLTFNSNSMAFTLFADIMVLIAVTTKYLRNSNNQIAADTLPNNLFYVYIDFLSNGMSNWAKANTLTRNGLKDGINSLTNALSIESRCIPTDLPYYKLIMYGLNKTTDTHDLMCKLAKNISDLDAIEENNSLFAMQLARSIYFAWKHKLPYKAYWYKFYLIGCDRATSNMQEKFILRMVGIIINDIGSSSDEDPYSISNSSIIILKELKKKNLFLNISPQCRIEIIQSLNSILDQGASLNNEIIISILHQLQESDLIDRDSHQLFRNANYKLN